MRWFKHFVDDSLFIADLQKEFGDAGYAFWFKVCELYAAYGDEQGQLTISWSNLERRMHKKRVAVERLLDFCSTADKLQISKGERDVTISSPIFLEMLDNYTKYQKGKRKDFEETSKKLKPEEKRGEEKREEEIRREGEEKIETGAPSLDEVKSLFKARGFTMHHEAEKFFHHYEANGWRIGQNEMRDWRAAAESWIARIPEFGSKQPHSVPYIPKARTEPPTCSKCGTQHQSWQLCPSIEVAPPQRVSALLKETVKKLAIS